MVIARKKIRRNDGNCSRSEAYCNIDATPFEMTPTGTRQREFTCQRDVSAMLS